jgi:hypothetical protein
VPDFGGNLTARIASRDYRCDLCSGRGPRPENPGAGGSIQPETLPTSMLGEKFSGGTTGGDHRVRSEKRRPTLCLPLFTARRLPPPPCRAALAVPADPAALGSRPPFYHAERHHGPRACAVHSEPPALTDSWGHASDWMCSEGERVNALPLGNGGGVEGAARAYEILSWSAFRRGKGREQVPGSRATAAISGALDRPPSAGPRRNGCSRDAAPHHGSMCRLRQGCIRCRDLPRSAHCRPRSMR